VTLDDRSPLLGATVTISRPNRANVTTVTDGNGRFAAGGFAPDTYTVTASLAGFNDAQRVVELTASRGVNLTTVLHISSVAESITVTASTAPKRESPISLVRDDTLGQCFTARRRKLATSRIATRESATPHAFEMRAQ
jgi:hypothetical protein